MEEINFPPDVRKMLFVLLGEQPLQARENLLWSSRNLYLAFQKALIRLRESARETIVKARDSLPPEVAEQYVQGLTMLIGEGYGNDPVQRLIDQLDDLADNQIDLSQKVQGSKWEIIAEIIMLIAELAILAALMAFTGGASVSQMFLARARSRFAILMIVDRLLRMTHLMPTISEALEEAIQTLAVRLAQIGLNDGGRKPDGVDWGDVGKAAAFGALTGAFMGVFETFFKPFKNLFKNFMDDVLTKFKFDPDSLVFKGLKNAPGEITGAFVIGGASEGLAEFIIKGAFEGNWDFKWETFVGGGSSAVFDLGAGLAAGGAGLYTYNKWFADNSIFNDHINDLPGTKGPLGSGGDSGPAKSSFSNGPSGPGTTTGGGNTSLFTPGPVTPTPWTTSSTGPFGGNDGIVAPPPSIPVISTSVTSSATTPTSTSTSTQSGPLNTLPDVTADLSTSNPSLVTPPPVTNPSLSSPSLTSPNGSTTPSFAPPRTSDSSPLPDYDGNGTTTPDFDLDSVLNPDGVSTAPGAQDDGLQSTAPKANGAGGNGSSGGIGGTDGTGDQETVRDGVQTDEDPASDSETVAPSAPVSTSAGPQGASNGSGAQGSTGPSQQPGQSGQPGQSNRPGQSEGSLDQSDVSGGTDIADGADDTDGAESPGVIEGQARGEGSVGSAADSDNSAQGLDGTSPGAKASTPPPSSPGTAPPGLRTSSDTPGQLDAELVESPVGDGPIVGRDVPSAAQPGGSGRPTAPRGAQTPGAPLSGEDADPAGAPEAQDQDDQPGSESQPPATDDTARPATDPARLPTDGSALPVPSGPARISTAGGSQSDPDMDLGMDTDLGGDQDTGYGSDDLDERTPQLAPASPARISTTGGSLPDPKSEPDLFSDQDSGYGSADDLSDLGDLGDLGDPDERDDRDGVDALADAELPAAPGVVATASMTPTDSTDAGATVSVATVTAPIRPEQWRGRQAGAPSAVLRTERYDPAADPLAQGPGRGKGTLGGRDTVIRVSIERVQADDGRWVRNLTLNLPVAFGEGFSADQLDDYQGSLRELLDTFVNGGPDPLPKSGDQLNLDLNFVHAPDHPEAIKLSRVDRPTDFDQFEFQLYAEDPSLGTEESDRRREADSARALHELLHYAGLADRSLDLAFLFRRTRNAAVDSSGIMADPDTLPEPGLPAHYLRSIEDVTDSGPAVVDHPLTAAPVVTGSKNPADLLAPAHLRPAHPPSQASIGLTTTSATADDIEGLWDSAVEDQDGDGDGILTLTVDGGSVTAGDLTHLVLERIGAADRTGDITVPKPGAKLKVGAKHKVLLSYNTDGRRGTLSREIRIESAQSTATASASSARPGTATTSGPLFEPGITPAANQRKLEVGRRIGAVLNGLLDGGERTGEVTGPAVLTGGAQATARFSSPRPLDGLEFRLATDDVRQYEDVVNQALAEHFPSPSGSSPNVLRADTGNPGTLSGRIDGVEITIGPDGGLHDDTTEVQGHTVPSVLDSAIDTAYTLAVTADQRQRASALFDLLWMLGAHPGLDAALAEELVKRRGTQYTARPPVGGKNDLTAQFSQVLAPLIGDRAAREALPAQWRAFGATPQDITRLR